MHVPAWHRMVEPAQQQIVSPMTQQALRNGQAE